MEVSARLLRKAPRTVMPIRNSKGLDKALRARDMPVGGGLMRRLVPPPGIDRSAKNADKGRYQSSAHAGIDRYAHGPSAVGDAEPRARGDRLGAPMGIAQPYLRAPRTRDRSRKNECWAEMPTPESSAGGDRSVKQERAAIRRDRAPRTRG